MRTKSFGLSRPVRLLVVALVAGLMTAGLLAAPAVAADGRITGKVVDSTGAPAAGSVVVAYRVSLGSGEVSEAGRAAVSDSGSYAISLAPGSYRLYFRGLPQHRPEYWKDAESVYVGDPVTVASGGTAAGRDAELALGNGLRGRVVDDNGRPVPETLISVYDYSTGEYTGEIVADATTDEDGWFRLYSLPAGTYRVSIAPVWLRWEFWKDAKRIGEGQDIVVPSDGATEIQAEVEPWTRNTTPPAITGTPRIGSPMKASLGEWTHTSDIRFAYQWSMDGVAIDAGKQADYTPTPGTLGKRLTVTVTASHAGEVVARSTSSPTEKVEPGQIEVVRAPTLKGRAVVGSTLEADRGYWTPSGLTWNYVWVRDGKAIPTSVPGSRSARYTLTAADWGKKVAVRVSGERSGYGVQRRYTPAVSVLRTPSMSNTTTVLGGGRVQLTAKVVVVGATNPVGTVAVLEDGEQVGTIASLSKGVGSIVLTGRSPGSHTYTLEYSGNRLVEPASRSRTVTVR